MLLLAVAARERGQPEEDWERRGLSRRIVAVEEFRNLTLC
jgi:hypothetical protein